MWGKKVLKRLIDWLLLWHCGMGFTEGASIENIYVHFVAAEVRKLGDDLPSSKLQVNTMCMKIVS